MNKKEIRLIIVEDNTDDVALLVRELKNAGLTVKYEVVSCEADLRSALSSGKWDCVTSDHMMPRFSSQQAVKIVREMSPELPIVIVSGEIELNLAVSLLKSGADDYVSKGQLPLVVPSIESAIERRNFRVEQHNQQDRVALAEKRLRTYFNLPVVGAIITDRDNRTLEVNPCLATMLGFTTDNLMACSFESLMSCEDYSRIEKALTQTIKGSLSKSPVEVHLKHRDGHLVPVRITGNDLGKEHSDCDHYLFLVVDLSDRQELRKEVADSQKLLSAIGKMAPVAYYVYDLRSQCLRYSSAEIDSMFGPPNESKLRSRIHKDDFEPFDQRAERLLALKDGESLLGDYRVKGSDGQYRVCRFYESVFERSADGQPELIVGVQSDITDLSEIQQRLSESDQRYEALVEVAKVGILTVDASGTIQYANPAFHELAGQSYPDISGKVLYDFIPNEFRPFLRKLIKSTGSGNAQSRSFDIVIHSSDGSKNMCRATATPVESIDAQNTILVVQDVMDRVDTFEATKASEELFSKTFLLGSMPSILIDSQSATIASVNNAFCSWVGLDRDSLVGLKADRLTTILGDEGYSKLVSGCIEASNPLLQTVELRDREGKNVPFSPLCSKFEVARKEFMQITLFDLTAYSQTVGSKDFQQERLDRLFDDLPGFVYRYSAERGYKVQFVSTGVEKITGYEPGDFNQNKGISFIDLIHSEDRDRVLKCALDSSVSHQTYFCEYRIQSKDGDLRWISDIGRCISAPLGTPMLFEGIATDITARIQAEETSRDSIATMTNVIRHFPLGLFIYSLNDKNQLILLGGNDEAERQTGIHLSQQVGKSFDELFPRANKTGITDAFVNVVLNQKGLDIDQLAYDDHQTSGMFSVHAFPIPGSKLVVGFKKLDIN